MERLLTLYSEVQSTDVRWLWYPFIAIGKITLLQGDPGDGKSTMMMNLIAELSTGGKTPDGCKIGTPQKVIYQCSEDGVSDTIKPRLERCGADCRKIAFINEEVYNGLNAVVLFGEEVNKNVAIVYSPLNGTGLKPVTRTLKEMGYTNITVVKEQEQPDGKFPTCPYPNPEIKEAMALGMEYAKKPPRRLRKKSARVRKHT